jgi:hypothetical protein
MTTLVNSTAPYLRILLSDGNYAQFHGGRLDISEDDPFYSEVIAEGARNPSIAILINSTTCQFCGEDFSGDTAGKQADAHKKEVHFDLWIKQQEIDAATIIQKEVKARAGFACDVCAPVQTFGTDADLNAHIQTLHTNPPALDEDGNTIGGPDDGDGRRPGEVDPPRAATASRRK